MRPNVACCATLHSPLSSYMTDEHASPDTPAMCRNPFRIPRISHSCWHLLPACCYTHTTLTRRVAGSGFSKRTGVARGRPSAAGPGWGGKNKSRAIAETGSRRAWARADQAG